MLQASGTHESDLPFVSAVLSGSRAHLDRLTDHFLPCIYQYAHQRAADPIAVESICERTFVRLLDTLPEFGPADHLDAWVFAALRATLAEAHDDGLV